MSQSEYKDFEIIADKIFRAVFNRKCEMSLDDLQKKFAFDIKLPTLVHDSITGEPAYTAMPNAKSYVTIKDSYKREWMLEKRPTKSLSELIKIWGSVNAITCDRAYDSQNVVKSDPIYSSSNVYASTNCGSNQNILFCDSEYGSNFVMACQRSSNLNFCIRVDDSNACSNSYNVICSGKISNSMFIQDCSSLHECIFCSHIANHEYCIANMQYTKDEYLFIKEKIIDWILDGKK